MPRVYRIVHNLLDNVSMEIEIFIGLKSYVFLLLDYFLHLRRSPNDSTSICKIVHVPL